VAFVDFEVDGEEESEFEGVSNSGGRTAGVAWTLVISFAREQ